MSSPYKLHVHSIVNSQISQHNNAGDLYTHATFLITQYPKVSTDFTLPKSKYFLDHVWNRRVARGRAGCNWVQCTHTPIWFDPQGICRKSKTNLLINPPPPPKWHPTISICCLCWTARFQKFMCMQDVLCNVIDSIIQSVGFVVLTKPLFTLVHIYIHTHTHSICTQHYIHIWRCVHIWRSQGRAS